MWSRFVCRRCENEGKTFRNSFTISQLATHANCNAIPLSCRTKPSTYSLAIPGRVNVRELQHFVQRLLIFCQSSVVHDVDVQDMLNEEPASTPGEPDWKESLGQLVQKYFGRPRGEQSYDQFVSEVELRLLSEALGRTKGNQTLAARFLGLTRSTLQAKVARYGLRDKPIIDTE